MVHNEVVCQANKTVKVLTCTGAISKVAMLLPVWGKVCAVLNAVSMMALCRDV